MVAKEVLSNQPFAIIPIAKEGSSIVRDSEGKKVIGTKPIASYINKWEKNLVTTKDLTKYDNRPFLFHTGKSNIIAIDFDSNLFLDALKLNDELPEEQKCTNISQSLGKQGGHFLYRYSENKLTEYINNPNGKKKHQLDTLYGNTLVFASNSANKTKALLTSSNDMIEIPLAMQLLIINHYLSNEKSTPQQQYKTQHITGSKLANLAEPALTNDLLLFKLLGAIMTNSYKEMFKMSHKEHLNAYHPDRLPSTESGHMYLLSLANVLRLDQSIDAELYKKLIYRVNTFFSEPLDEARIKATIIQPDLAKFVYDKDWKSKSLTILSNKSEPLEVFKYTERGKNKFLIYNGVTHELIHYESALGVLEYLASMSKYKNLKKDALIDRAIHVTLIDRPDMKFGFLASDDDEPKDRFNLYRWNEVQEVFYNPKIHMDKYKYPGTIIGAIGSAMGESTRDNLFLPFLKRKLMTRDHSALFFVLYGVPHSFKSGLFNGVLSHFAPRRSNKLSLSVMVDKYNDWQINTDFVLLDEIHHLLHQELTQLTKEVNEVTGNKTISGVRAMHKSLDSSITYQQEMTIFMTTNETVQLTTEARDRRMVVFRSTQRLSDSLGMSNLTIERNINNEIVDFAYYLATEVKELEGDAYITNEPWKSEHYYDFIESGLSVVDRLAKYIDDDNIEQLFATCLEEGLTAEEVNRCIYSMERTGNLKLRLFNSKNEVAEVEGLFNKLPSLNLKKLRQKIKLCENVKSNIVEYYVGSSDKTGSRKTEMHIFNLPEGFKPYNGIDEIEDAEDIDIEIEQDD